MLVTTDIAFAPKEAIVRMSAWMPAPPVLSEPVMVRMGFIVQYFLQSRCQVRVSANNKSLTGKSLQPIQALKKPMQNNEEKGN